jgi:hypothetical protein
MKGRKVGKAEVAGEKCPKKIEEELVGKEVCCLSKRLSRVVYSQYQNESRYAE